MYMQTPGYAPVRLNDSANDIMVNIMEYYNKRNDCIQLSHRWCVCVCVTDIRQRQCNSNVNINETLGSLKDTHTHTERKNNENVHNNSSNGISEFVAFIATPVHKNR